MRMAGDRISFGAGAITGEQGYRRTGEDVKIGRASSGSAAMPQDLQAGYLQLGSTGVPGSPLPEQGLLLAGRTQAAKANQDYARNIKLGY